MCGIAGFISSQYTESHLKKMTDTLQHRGPNAEGLYYDKEKKIGLGHRRLSILDLSEAANQPFFSNDKRYVFIYNGEVYNFKELTPPYFGVSGVGFRVSETLQSFQNSNTPKTHSDTEIVLEAFVQRGVESFKDLNGMFAFAIWDTIEATLYIVRDRVGIKPLYYYFDGHNFAFASEIKALLPLPIDKTLNTEAIANYLYLGYFTEQHSIFKHIKKFPAGCVGVFRKNELSITPYWSLENSIENNTICNEKEAKRALKTLLIDSVQKQMISDVPLGTFLSGGIDSSVVTAIAQSLSDKPIKTFTIGSEDSKFDETPYARAVATHLKSEHYEYIVSPKETLDMVHNLLDIYDEPFGDASAIPTLLVSKLARQEVTVTLSGDGGDELFMGYAPHQWAQTYSNPLINTLKKPIVTALQYTKNERFRKASRVLNYPNQGRFKSHITSQYHSCFSEIEIEKMLKNTEGVVNIDEKMPTVARQLNPSEAQTYFDFKHYLKDDLLVKVDRASMYYGLETRVPLLDHRLVELAFNIDKSLKIKGKKTKYLLKQVLYDYIPPPYFDRPKKGFSIPLAAWLKTDLRYLIDDYLSKESVENANICHYEEVEKLKNTFSAGQDFVYNRLWLLILLHKWILQNCISKS